MYVLRVINQFEEVPRTLDMILFLVRTRNQLIGVIGVLCPLILAQKIL